MAKRSKSSGPFPKPEFVKKIEEKIVAFLDWIAPVVDWAEDQAEKYKAAYDDIPPPSKRWVKNRRINTGKATVTVFLTFLAVMTVLALYLPNRPNYSEQEQRELTHFPTPTFIGVLNGAFFDDINTWFADTFPMREMFLSVHTGLEDHYGFRSWNIVGDVVSGDDIPVIGSSDDSADASAEPDTSEDTSSSAEASTPTSSELDDAAASSSNTNTGNSNDNITDADMETLGPVLLVKDSAYEYYSFNQSLADEYIALLNRAAEQLKGKANVYDIVAPTSMDVCLPEKTRKKVSTSDQRAAIDYLYSGMSAGVTTVEVLDTLLARQEEGDYLYFRTDHHWTALGAYYAYSNFIQLTGKEPVSLDDFDSYVFEGFTGSFYRQTSASAMLENPDTVYAYGPKATNDIYIIQPDGSELNYHIISNADEMSAVNKYLTFIGGDNPFSVIENHDLTDGSAIMVIKDSFGNCFAPYLVEHYQYVYVVDYRSIADVDGRTLPELVEDYQISDVLFLDNISDTREQMLIDLMTPFIG